MKINDVAKLTGTTVRTLHYYDEIGLLKPSGVTGAGYRIYDNDALETLQQILFFRELDFPLEEIKQIMANPNYDKISALHNQKTLLVEKRNHFNNLITLIDSTIEGEKNMSFKEFDTTGFVAMKEKYAAEVKERFGNTLAFKESEEKTSDYNTEKWNFVDKNGNNLLSAFAELRHTAPSSTEAQKLVKKWQDYITENFYTCTSEILSGLGKMYILDERFTNNIDKNGNGTAQFMSDAIGIYCNS